MTAQAYVSIRPTADPRITIICRPCHLETPAQRRDEARDQARAHNREHHSENT